MRIISVRSNHKGFKTVNFEPGFNVVLADRKEESTKLDSRNGLGKTSLIQVIRFCLGCNPGSTLKHEALKDWLFYLDVEIDGKEFTVARSVAEKSKVFVKGDYRDWPIQPVSTDSEFSEMRALDWSKVLGIFVFNMELDYSGYSFKPSFGSCISYFIRNGEGGGFLSPFKQHSNQLEWDKQVNNSFLLGLDWTFANRWQLIKDRKRFLDQLKRETESGLLNDIKNSLGELDAKRVRLEGEIKKQDSQLKSFSVHPRYQEIENEATRLTEQIHILSNENVSDKNILEHYQNSIKEEKDADIDTVKKMYKEAGVIFDDKIVNKLEDVKKFHEAIATNREEFLKSEIERIKRDIAKRDEEKTKYSEKRKKLLLILKTHKALEEHTKLQQTKLDLVAELNAINQQIDNLNKFEEGKSDLKIELETLKQEARVSLGERNEIKEMAINFFNSNSEALYDRPGNLLIDVAKTGYRFKVEIERAGSHGVNLMKVFTYDLTLAQIWSSINNFSVPLVHDSLIYADVDERQIAHAIELAAKESKSKGFQYICALNSDALPVNDFSEDFDINEYVRVTFTDLDKKGGLFGVRF